jgi:hypothetical protein
MRVNVTGEVVLGGKVIASFKPGKDEVPQVNNEYRILGSTSVSGRLNGAIFDTSSTKSVATFGVRYSPLGVTALVEAVRARTDSDDQIQTARTDDTSDQSTVLLPSTPGRYTYAVVLLSLTILLNGSLFNR